MKFWCATAFMDTTEMVHVATLLDRAGYHGLMVSDHLVHPRELTSPYPYSPHPDGRPIWEPETAWPDPWVLIGAMSALTTQLRFTTNVYVAPHRPILQLAKEVATASVISGGRVMLGAGAGWMREEFELQGQEYATRGKRLTEMVRALRELWKGGWVEWHGDHYDIPELMMEPHPPAPVPIYIGGYSDIALKRAAQVGDGWIGGAYPYDEAVQYARKLKEYLRAEGRAGEPFEIILGIYEMPSADLYRRAEDDGITAMMCQPWALANLPALPALAPGEQRTLDEVAAVYQSSIDEFAEQIVHRC
ncbi:MAG: TIGR03619 family F420-dependent LLM class oxidoreductase [Ilumatobacteraceae bacterium]